MKTLLLSLSSLLAAMPGVATLASGLGVPPGEKLVFGGMLEMIGVLALLLMYLNRVKLRKMSNRRSTRLALRMGAGAVALIAAYILLFSVTVKKHETRGTAYFPLWTSGKLARMVERAGSRSAAIERYGIDGVQLAINEMPDLAMALTTVTLLATYVGGLTLATIAFGIPGFRLRDDP